MASSVMLSVLRLLQGAGQPELHVGDYERQDYCGQESDTIAQHAEQIGVSPVALQPFL